MRDAFDYEEGAEPCPFCGEPQIAEVFEIWSDHSFMLDTCCLAMKEWMDRELSDEAEVSTRRSSSTQTRDWLDQYTGAPVRRVAEHEGQLLLDYNLSIQPVTLAEARAFVFNHHRHRRKPPRGWRYGAAIFNGSTRLGVVMVGRPVSRVLDGTKAIVEVNRLCLDFGLPAPLRWNACSMAYTWAAREAEAKGWSKIITYTRTDEDGGSLRACGWIPAGFTKGRQWGTEKRPREESEVSDRTRWEKVLHPRRPRATLPVEAQSRLPFAA